MEKKSIEKIKGKLEKKKKDLEEQISKIATKDPQIKEDWDVNFPDFNKRPGDQRSEEAADEVEEYSNLKPVEHTLELKLQKVNQALDKIEKNQYGICEKCQKPINSLRLKIAPEVETCLKCKK